MCCPLFFFSFSAYNYCTPGFGGSIHVEAKKKKKHAREKQKYLQIGSLIAWRSASSPSSRFFPSLPLPVALFNVQTLAAPSPLVAQSPFTTPTPTPDPRPPLLNPTSPRLRLIRSSSHPTAKPVSPGDLQETILESENAQHSWSAKDSNSDERLLRPKKVR